MEEEKKNKKSNIKEIIIAIIPLLSFIAVTIGMTYAVYVANVVGNDDSVPTNLKTAQVFAMFEAHDSINLEGMLPGASDSIHFSIVNTSEAENAYGNYTLMWEINKNEIDSDNFVYTLEGTSTKGEETVESSTKNKLVTTTTPRKVPTATSSIGTGTINTGVTHDYTLTVRFIENGLGQDDLQGKKFEGKIVAKGEPGE